MTNEQPILQSNRADADAHSKQRIQGGTSPGPCPRAGDCGTPPVIAQTDARIATSPATIDPRDVSAGWPFHALLLVLCSIVIVLAVAMEVEGPTQVRLPGMQGPLPDICMMKRSFNVDCPGCGMTRSFISLGHGQIGRSLRFHPLGWLMFSVILFQIPYRIAQLHRLRQGRRELRIPGDTRLLLAVAMTMVALWLVRLGVGYL